MASDEASKKKLVIIQNERSLSDIRQIPPTTLSQTGFFGFSASSIARREKALAVAEEARLRRVIASQEIAYLEGTVFERLERRRQAEGEEAALASLQRALEKDALLSKREAIAQDREERQLESLIRTQHLELALLELLEGEQEEEISPEDLVEKLSVLREYLTNLELEKADLVQREAKGEAVSWNMMQEIVDKIEQYKAIYRGIHEDYTKAILGIA